MPASNKHRARQALDGEWGGRGEMIPDPFDGEIDQQRERVECECQVCHELFLGYPGDNICDRCAREQIINGNE